MIYIFNINIIQRTGGSVDVHPVTDKSSLKLAEGATDKESQWLTRFRGRIDPVLRMEYECNSGRRQCGNVRPKPVSDQD